MYTIQNKIYGFIQTLPITRLSSNSFKASIVPSREYILWIWGLRDPLLMSLSKVLWKLQSVSETAAI